MPHKIYLAVSSEAQKKIGQRISTFFKNKVFENITDNNTDLTAAQKLPYFELLCSQTSGILQ